MNNKNNNNKNNKVPDEEVNYDLMVSPAGLETERDHLEEEKYAWDPTNHIVNMRLRLNKYLEQHQLPYLDSHPKAYNAFVGLFYIPKEH